MASKTDLEPMPGRIFAFTEQQLEVLRAVEAASHAEAVILAPLRAEHRPDTERDAGFYRAA